MRTVTKRDRILYWVFTSLFVLMDGVMPALTFNTPLAKAGIAHLQYPDYFRIELSVGKIIGGILLIFPFIPARFKEWAYVGFGISIISAFIGHMVIDGPGQGQSYAPVIGFLILLASYVFYHRVYRPYRTEAQA